MSVDLCRALQATHTDPQERKKTSVECIITVSIRVSVRPSVFMCVKAFILICALGFIHTYVYDLNLRTVYLRNKNDFYIICDPGRIDRGQCFEIAIFFLRHMNK